MPYRGRDRKKNDLKDKLMCEFYAHGEYKAESEEPNIPAVDEWHTKWTKSTVTWKIVWDSIYFEDTPKKFDFEDKAVRTAFRVWGNRIKDIKFRRERDPDKRADIEIFFTKNEDRADKWKKGEINVLAYAYYPTSNPDQWTPAGDIYFNEWVIWTKDGKPITAKRAKELGWIENYSNPDNLLNTYKLVHTLIHEIGHSIGLKHSDNSCKECIMSKYYNGITELHQNDIKRIQSFYGISTLPNRIINYFRNRLSRGIIR